ncbi:MAG: adenosylcobalamin-dependent ribonucleoside-diphosphate reductase [Candidatus Eremiobacter antarcticus]|nr:adenosylcobalamin-dependent ribonucleoside-diphosphate reductase [Candidatus Eremiobacteraeota bacterium]MBC5808953.1 adenosylcobalamin-dependent ribonucleoside-diphosphate reductase [Candidatus Eremiobacteraeota bacterium]PZR60367.1 MAG: adenosylcobalamin-dependent ribonucleoside-diphosphate reductase [Candidatus Eremiobacter sp. RRmetagenome_bin22]
MKIQRRFTKAGTDPLDELRWSTRESVIREPDGTVVFELRGIEVPEEWSQVATDILAQKYFRKAGVPQPDGTLGRETSARQVIRRMAGCWTDWGRRYDYFDSDDDAAAFDAEISHMLIHQMAAPNSPQWFNTGLSYAYGITGPPQGHYYVDPATVDLVRATDSYAHPQPHACLPGDAQINAPEGAMPIGEICSRNLIGLTVYDKDATTRIVAVKNNGVKPVWRIELEFGKFLDATADHRVLVSDPVLGKIWSRVDELEVGAKLLRRFDTEVSQLLGSLVVHDDATSTGGTAVQELQRWMRGKQSTLVAPTLCEVAVTSMRLLGEQLVYDIETESHNFLANNVVVHNCFIQSVEDDLVNDNGIMDLWVREARIFKFGSGSGSNFSNIRAEGEKLSGGGSSSGLMSFLRVGDRAAGAIKSGGTTRRAAKMVILDIDHPDIQKFINWKVEEEKKVAALIAAGYESAYEGEAYNTVSGQNSNNSVRIPDRFIDAVRNDGSWDLLWRRDKTVARSVRARDLWDEIARAAWACADPGIQYDDIINSWHTCPAGGRIRASNPCSEYMFLDDTACNLASINLMRFYDAENNRLDIDGLKHACRLWTIVLEISVLMAQFPSPEIARKSYEYRTLGLGYANLGTLLMVSGIPYDSPRALALTGAISAILTGESYAASAEMASHLGPFSRYKENAEPMLRVMRNHRRAAYNAAASEYEGLSVVPMGVDAGLCPPYILSAARECWDRAVALGERYGYRNAQATCIAPTGTIALLMDCDTTGIEPDFALVKFKKLAGGGYFKIINQSIPLALRHLGYGNEQISDIVRYANGSGSLYGAPYVNAETLRARGFSDDDIAKIEKALPTVFDLSFAFNQWTLGEESLQRLGFSAQQYEAADFDLLKHLGFTRDEIEAATNYVCGTMTVEGAPHLKEEHYAVFDCANKCGRLGRRFIHHMGHVRMMAAAQPMISGALSKTINLPNEATVDDIKEAYMRSWDLGLKSIALYRDGSKLSQPLSNKSDKDTGSDRQLALSEEFARQLEEARRQRAEELRPDEILAAAQRILANATNTDFKRKVAQALERNRLPAKRRGWTQKAKISGHTLFLRTGEYADGTLGEIFVDMHKEGASFRSLMNCFAIAVSIGLQYGVPLEEFVDKFIFTRFEPNGFVDHPNIKHCTSVVDYIFRVLGMEYLKRTDFVQIKPEDEDVDQTHAGEDAHGDFEARVSAAQALDDLRSAKPAAAEPQAGNSGVGAKKTNGRAGSEAKNRAAAAPPNPQVAAQLNALRSREAQMASLMGDAPMCDVCGSLTRRNGTCYVCDSCGRSMGCS